MLNLIKKLGKAVIYVFIAFIIIIVLCVGCEDDEDTNTNTSTDNTSTAQEEEPAAEEAVNEEEPIIPENKQGIYHYTYSITETDAGSVKITIDDMKERGYTCDWSVTVDEETINLHIDGNILPFQCKHYPSITSVMDGWGGQFITSKNVIEIYGETEEGDRIEYYFKK